MSLDRATMIRRAFNLAGVMAPSGQYQDGDYDMAVDLLTTDLDSLQEQGIVLQNVYQGSLNITAGEEQYALPSTYLNVVVGPDSIAGTVRDVSDTGESPVRAISRHEYVTGTLDKTATATLPTHVYIQKVATSLSLFFWPVPSTTLGLFTYQAIALDEAMDDFRRFQKAVMWTLAASIARAKSKPLQDVQGLEKRAEDEIRKARASDQELGPAQLYVPRMWGR